MGPFWPPLEPKTENCFSPISLDWFIRRITEVLNFGINLNFTVAMVTKIADKIGLKLRNEGVNGVYWLANYMYVWPLNLTICGFWP